MSIDDGTRMMALKKRKLKRLASFCQCLFVSLIPVKKITSIFNISLLSFRRPCLVYFHLLFPFNTKSNHFSYQTCYNMPGRVIVSALCLCTVGSEGVLCVREVKARRDWWSGHGERESDRERNRRKWAREEEKILGRIIMMMSTTKRDLKGNYGNVDTLAWRHTFTSASPYARNPLPPCNLWL